MDWNSPQMREVEKEWHRVWDAHAKIRDKNVEAERAVDRFMEKRISPQNVRHLAATADFLPAHAGDRSRFENEMLAFLVKAFVKSGDRDSLVGLLSKRCESHIDGPELIEFSLIRHGQKLTDPILILGEAFARCEVPETRHLLAAAVRRGFADFGIHGANDAQYVRNAMLWYENNKKSLVLNWRYILNEIGNPSFTMESYEANPEFYDNPPGVRDPLFVRPDDRAIKDVFRWQWLLLASVAAAVTVALLMRRAKRRPVKTVSERDPELA
jgi:hypothetical protein